MVLRWRGDEMSFEESHRRVVILALALFPLVSLPILRGQAPPPTSRVPADNTYIDGAVLWQQTSGERRALSYQAFTLAHIMLDRDLRMNRNRKPRAIIVDVDE